MIISTILTFTITTFAEPCDSVKKNTMPDDVVFQMEDSMIIANNDTVVDEVFVVSTDTIPKVKQKRDWATWRPDPKKALWLAIVIPGAGQIYNRKYWKLPIIYGGFVGCAYAMRWNNMMYQNYSQIYNYSQSYDDLMTYIGFTNNESNTQSRSQFQYLGSRITESNLTRYQELFRKRKDRFRRWRDLSFFVMCGVYALSVIDAYVDASLSEFDISDDLSMRVSPTIIYDHKEYNPLKSSAIGLQCSLLF